MEYTKKFKSMIWKWTKYLIFYVVEEMYFVTFIASLMTFHIYRVRVLVSICILNINKCELYSYFLNKNTYK